MYQHPKWIALMYALALGTFADQAWGQNPSPEIALADLSLQVRSALGFDPTTMAALNVTATDYDRMVATAMSYVSAHRAQLQVLLQDLNNAHQQLVLDARDGNDLAQTGAAVMDKEAALTLACSSLSETLAGQLPAPAQGGHASVPNNPGIDPLLRLVDLTEGQKAQIRALQWERDRTTMNPMSWHRRWAVVEAEKTFTNSLSRILTSAQQARLNALGAAWEANCEVVLSREAAAVRLANAQAKAAPILPTGDRPGVWLASAVRVFWPAVRQWLQRVVDVRMLRAEAEPLVGREFAANYYRPTIEPSSSLAAGRP